MLNTESLFQLFEQLQLTPSESLESENVEFKNYSSETALHNSKDLAEEISALANWKGGIIIIGVRDSSEIVNSDWGKQLQGFVIVDLDTTKERITGKLKPHLHLHLEYFQFEDKQYLCIHIPKRSDTIVSTSSGKVCVRDGKSSRPASPDEIRDMVKGLQFYDWSSEDVPISSSAALDQGVIERAKQDYCQRRHLRSSDLDTQSFLESINATRNGILNKAGLLFLGNPEYIRRYLGHYEYRYTWKTNSGQLIINEVWENCLWITIQKAKQFFDSCNKKLNIEHKGEYFELFQLDQVAFHEAFLNALVHRDYSHSGMVSVNYTDKQLKISSPGSFYGGITSDNIVFHEPRHRNKTLASTLMLFHLVDRAGVGVTRMGLRSLMYGRSFPKFIEKQDSVEVVMEAEYFRPAIFVITRNKSSFGVVELFILNSVFGIGHISIAELEKRLVKIVENPWQSIAQAMNNEELKAYVQFKGTNKGVYVCVNDMYFDMFEVKRRLRTNSTSDKHIALYKYLKEFGSGSNDELSNILGHKHASQTSLFLKNTEYVVKGKSIHSKWTLV